ncbi:MAG: hypothetical protein DHS20C14_14150 [Phycisphaeraceae bacterium]|nr:MAG: hypothetical protein DHS20C14_14150 [Phycisphaeraceae bacterium]
MTNTKYTTPPPADLIPAWRHVFERQKAFAEHAFEQLSDELFFRAPAEGVNSVAVIAQHVAGNLHSRFTDFLTADGEKPWRDREAEFAIPEPTGDTRAEILTRWVTGWHKLFAALDGLTPEDLTRAVTIRGVPHAVHAAIARAIDHSAFHTGQINVIARMHVGTAAWKWFTIAPGGTAGFNASLGHTTG